jgi:hypothetical protein
MPWSKLTGSYRRAKEAISTSSGSATFAATPGRTGSRDSAKTRRPPAKSFDVATIPFSFTVRDKLAKVPVALGFNLLIGFVDVPKESWKPYEKADTDEILQRLDVAIEVNHGVQLLDFSDRICDLIKQIVHFSSPAIVYALLFGQ